MQPPSSQEALPEQLRTLLLTLEKIAQSYFMLGHLELALQLFQIGMQLLHVPEVTQRDQATLLLHYGNMLTIKTVFENAPIEEALERRRGLYDERGVSESLFHLGLIAEVLDQMEVAHSSYMQALQIAQQQDYPLEASDVLRHLGLLEQAQGNFTQAQQYLTESLHLREHMGMHPYLPFACQAVADVCLAQGNVELASAQCQRALDLSRKMDIKKALIFSLLTYGRICQEKQEQKQARDYFEQAYAVAQAIDLKYAMQQAASALQHLPTNPGAQ